MHVMYYKCNFDLSVQLFYRVFIKNRDFIVHVMYAKKNNYSKNQI